MKWLQKIAAIDCGKRGRRISKESEM